MASSAIDPTTAIRIRRHEPTRLEGFVDASFAFAVTVLVISIGHVPTSVPDMLQALRGVPAFALSFLSIVRIWKAHFDWSRQFGLDDEASRRLSLLLVFVVLLYVYPLRLLFSLFFAWVSHGYLVDQPLALQNLEELRAAFEVYGLGFGLIAGTIALLYRHALRQAATIGLDAREVLATRMHVAIWSALVVIAAISIGCAALLPFRSDQPFVFTLPGTVYALTGIATGAIRRRYGQRLRALAGSA